MTMFRERWRLIEKVKAAEPRVVDQRVADEKEDLVWRF